VKSSSRPDSNAARSASSKACSGVAHARCGSRSSLPFRASPRKPWRSPCQLLVALAAGPLGPPAAGRALPLVPGGGSGAVSSVRRSGGLVRARVK
jgi:hypothetical protein